MKLVETAALSHPGRKRRHNEDAFVEQPPLFVVADGMGGAQAGEVASGLAAAAFRDFERTEGSPEERVAATIREANRRIFERAQTDTGASGMGTTVTAALVDDDRIAVGHVGDSRAYLVRDGRLEQLTEDHSLVADLIRSGRLTPEEAELHPQRSVITRALGTDPDVDVDSFSVELRPGDVVLLCSDGLTSMVDDDAIRRIVAGAPTLADATTALVRAANVNGGDDNITTVLFRVGAEDEAVVEPPPDAPTEPDLEDTLTGLEGVPTVPERPPAAQTAVFRVHEMPVWEAPETAPEPAAAVSRPAPPRRRRRGFRWLFWSSVALGLMLVLAAAAIWGITRANFVGADAQGRVTVYQGLPWELGAGIELYRARYVSELLAVQLSPFERAQLFDHSLTSYDTALAKVRRYEEEAVPAT